MHKRHPRTASAWLAAGIIGTAFMAGTARAQEAKARAAVRVGFGRGETFRNGANSVRLEGFEVGADVPLRPGPARGIGVYFSPTVTFGGSNRHGADTDGNVYRLLVNAKSRLGDGGAYGGVGVGYSFTQARVHEFRNKSGVAAELILGCDLGTARPGRAQPFLEATYHAGAHSQLSGASLDLGVRL